MPSRTVAEAYANYVRIALTPDAPRIQIDECRKAFYAGAYFLLTAIANYAGAEETTEDAGVAYLDALKRELEAFAAHLPTLDRAAAIRHLQEQLGRMNYTTPDPDHIQPLLQALGRHLADELPHGYGFNLLIFNFGPGGNMFYLSNAEREDMIRAMREFIQKQTQ